MKRGQFNKKFPRHFDFGAGLRKPFGESSFFRCVRQVKARARRWQLPCDLSESEFRRLFKGDCTYCGIPPHQKASSPDSHGFYIYNGIDREDPDQGYVHGNCVSCCGTCNRAKSNLSLPLWKEWINRIIKHNS